MEGNTFWGWPASRPERYTRAVTPMILLAVFLAPVALLPFLAAYYLGRELREGPGGRMSLAANAAAVGAGFWTFAAGALWIAGAVPGALVGVPPALGLALGGACAWRIEGPRRWVQLVGVFIVVLVPPLVIRSAAPSFRKALGASAGPAPGGLAPAPAARPPGRG